MNACCSNFSVNAISASCDSRLAYHSGRSYGRLAAMIGHTASTGATIVCYSQAGYDSVMRMAKLIGVVIPEPVKMFERAPSSGEVYYDEAKHWDNTERVRNGLGLLRRLKADTSGIQPYLQQSEDVKRLISQTN